MRMSVTNKVIIIVKKKRHAIAAIHTPFTRGATNSLTSVETVDDMVRSVMEQCVRGIAHTHTRDDVVSSTPIKCES